MLSSVVEEHDAEYEWEYDEEGVKNGANGTATERGKKGRSNTPDNDKD